MGQPDPTTPPAADDDPTAAELAQLRAEKKDRETAAAAEQEAELTSLRAFKADAEAKAAKKVTAPTPKADKVAAAPAVPAGTPAGETPKPSLPRGGVSRRWFGNQAD